MGQLEKVTKGKQNRPHLILVYGPDGIGKSTFAANAENPIFLGKEDGTSNLDVTRLPEPHSYSDIVSAINELIKEKHDYKTLAIDSLDWIEPLIWAHVCKANGWQNIEVPGYGKGYALANEVWRELIAMLADLRQARGMNIILIGHCQVKPFNDPSQPASYDRYQLKLNEKAASLWREFVDFVGFANYEVFTKTDKNQKTRAFGDGRRMLYTERRPSFDAKNRFGLPFELAFSFEEYERALRGSKTDELSVLLAEIKDLTLLVQNEETRNKVTAAVTAADKNMEKLKEIHNRLKVISQ